MWRSEFCGAVYATAAVPALPQSPHLPVYIEPQAEEALLCWICRMAHALGLSPGSLTRCAFGLNRWIDRGWWRRPAAHDLRRIHACTGLPMARIEEMTFAKWSTARDDELPERLNTCCYPLMLPADHRAASVCPQCLHEDEHPYLRLFWLAGWCGVCPKHQAILTPYCPSCLAPLRSPLVTSDTVIEIGCCRRCSVSLGSTLCEPAHPVVVRLQTALLEIKRNGTGSLATLGRLDWATAMALVDVLLLLVWDRSLRQDTDELCARIAADFALDADTQALTLWHHNYGNLLILAWLLDDLEDRLPFAIDTLQTPPLGQLIRRLPSASRAQCERLKDILAPGLARRRRTLKPWQCWIQTLPSGNELLVRAESAAHKHARERLQALAAVRNGASLRKAEILVHQPRERIRDWLDDGARRGLDAMLIPPRRRKQPPDAPADIAAITSWLAGIYRPSCGFHLWTVDRLIAAVKRNLGITLSSAGALSVIAAAHARRRPDYYERLAWRRSRRRWPTLRKRPRP